MSESDNSVERRAVRVRITGIVQGVGYRPFVYRLAQQYGITGWVRNTEDGVHVVAEAKTDAVTQFLAACRDRPPPAARVASFDVTAVKTTGFATFVIRESGSGVTPTVRISPDLAVCDDCLRELFDPADRRFAYPYINCTNCGPRYSIIRALPYDRARTVMRDWVLCDACRREYEDPADRRFHAEPVACPACGPTIFLEEGPARISGTGAIARAARLLAGGAIVAVKGIGGYHLACDARNPVAVITLRERKYRKERPFAVMARDLACARLLIDVDAKTESLLTSVERPIVLARARSELVAVAPHNGDLGVMLPYTPVHHLLFDAGAPDVLVMTSANRSSEPIAYDDDDARSSLRGIADALLVGERPIVRRIDDSIVRPASGGRSVLRRARGLSPAAVASLPVTSPILAVGGDLKNAMTLVIDGQAFASQHIGDLGHLSARDAFEATADDLCAMYGVDADHLTIVHDAHPGYESTGFARSRPGRHIAIQHHRAHIASVLAEHGAWDTPIIGFAFDGTGYGDDDTIWGGEVFTGSLVRGFDRVAHLRAGSLPGGDAAARFPVQAAAGFLDGIADDVAFDRPPFCFPERYGRARVLVQRRVRTFQTTSMGRLFDAVAALLGFIGEQSFEGQAAMWLEHGARSVRTTAPYNLPIDGNELDYRPLLAAIIADRIAGRPPQESAHAFHGAVAASVIALANRSESVRVVVSGGTFQNAFLTDMLAAELGDRLWLNATVPPNDGGLSLGQAAAAATAMSRTNVQTRCNSHSQLRGS